MKTTACIKLLALLLLAACDRTSKLSFEGGAPGGVHTIADLKARCTANSVAVTEDITLEGVVTGNDFYGEFYKTLVVEDASGGISVLIDRFRLPGRSGRHHLLQRAYAGRLRRQDSARSRARRRLRRRADSA